MISIQNVSKSYDGKKKSVDSISFDVKDGEIFGFLGPNGAGKTTTIKMITGILDIDDGDILIDGNSISKEPIDAKMNFGYVPDSPDVFLKITGMEYLNFLADIYCVPYEERKERIEDIAKKFEMYDHLSEKIESYSHGMRQKIIVIGSLIHSPKNLILDEPMTGLDPKSSHDLKEIMRAHADKGNSVFFSTHVLEVAEKLCDKIAIIDKGEIKYTGSVEELKEKYKNDSSLEEVFLKIIEE
jgi:ABC-2 type transport system ATP-binding protein